MLVSLSPERALVLPCCCIRKEHTQHSHSLESTRSNQQLWWKKEILFTRVTKGQSTEFINYNLRHTRANPDGWLHVRSTGGWKHTVTDLTDFCLEFKPTTVALTEIVALCPVYLENQTAACRERRVTRIFVLWLQVQTVYFSVYLHTASKVHQSGPPLDACNAWRGLLPSLRNPRHDPLRMSKHVKWGFVIKQKLRVGVIYNNKTTKTLNTFMNTCCWDMVIFLEESFYQKESDWTV